ncbi:MAG: fimbria/pilus outer membrane usher protein [Deltaproteobacteria bacterium]
MGALLLIAAIAMAGPATGAERPAGDLAQLDVRLNGAPRGESLVLLAGDDAWVAIEDLHGYGVQSFQGERRAWSGKEWVSLRSLAPQLRFDLDTRTFALSLTVGPALLGSERIDIGYQRPPGTVMGDATSAFVNYAAQVDLQKQVSGFGEAGVSSGPALLSSGFAVNPGGQAVRGITAFTYDLLARLEKLVVGDAVVSGQGAGTSGVVGGVTWSRDFSLDPYLVTAPRPAFTAFAPTPSVLEVWVNGAMVRQQQVPAGTLDLTGIPVVAGAGTVRTVLRDAYGREQAFDLRSNFAPGLLAPGLTEFSYTAGFLRSRLDVASFDYTRPMLLARQRVGLDEVVTVGGRAELSLDRAMAGPSITMGTVAGQVDLELLGSVAQGALGGSAIASWSWAGRRWSSGIRVRATSPAYATAVLDPWMDRPLADVTAYGSVSPLDRLGLGIDLVAARWRDGGDGLTATLRADLALGAGLTLLASVTHTVGGTAAGPGGMVSLSWAFGDRSTAQASAGAGVAGPVAAAAVSHTLPVGSGYGYRVEGQTGADVARGSGLFQYQTGFGRYEAQVDQFGSTTAGIVRAAGGIVVAGDRVFATRPVEEAYALVRVGVPGVTAYLENQEAGVTDEQGDLLVPALLARYSNRLSIRAADIPMDYEVGRVEQRVAPGRKSGMVVRFDVSPIRAVTGRLRIEGEGGLAPGGGELVVLQDGAELRAATTADGRFFLEGARPGAHDAEVIWRGGTCRATIVVAEKAGIQDVGERACDPRPRVASAN